MSRKKTVVVAMSGGVDSSVAAALLKEQGFDVLGMMLRLWSEPGSEDSNRCCTPESMMLARRVAAKLDIPFHVIDAKAAFKAHVVGAFLDGYARGATPNPCLECNRQIRWTLLFDHALAMGADFMATGHYARTRVHENGCVHLLRAVDASKDQSYVLHILDQAKLTRALFPIGAYMKSDVRELARGYGLPTESRRDSQDLCFLAGGNYRDFIQRHRPDSLKPGKMMNTNGDVLGEHDGLANYTIGQRKKLGLRSSVPLYVLRKDISDNSLIVGTESELGSRQLSTSDVNWIAGEPLVNPFRAQVKTRYTAAESPAWVEPVDQGRTARIVFDDRQRDITAGQAAVFYEGEILIGGGLIQ